jgi:hypothetical protein
VGHERHHLVPAGAIATVDHGAKTVTLKVTAQEVCSTPPHEDAETAYTEARKDYVGQFDRGMIGGGFVWPYVDE